MSEQWIQWLTRAVVLTPLLTFALLGVTLLAGARPSERLTAWLVRASQLITLGSISALIFDQWSAGIVSREVHISTWFRAGHYTVPIGALLDPLSLMMGGLTCVIAGLIGHFSVNYLHREPGYHRFFLMLLLFQFGMLMLVLGDSFDLLFVGWELVGLTSVLLIAFFFERTGPTAAGLRALITYRAADIGLLFGAVLVHQLGHSAEFSVLFGEHAFLSSTSTLTSGGATVVSLFLILACLGKSAQFPLGNWLPRAMEGPTPSSALFYGALSVHAGVYLMLRSAPLLQQSLIASAALVIVGGTTAVYANLVHGVQADAKGAIGYATMTQAGLMFVAIGLGFYRLAMVHLVGHAILRAYQILRTPSALKDMQMVRATHKGQIEHPSAPLDWMLPPRVRDALYRSAVERFHVDTILERWIVRPVLGFARGAEALERRLSGFVSGQGPKAPPPAASWTAPRGPNLLPSLANTAAVGNPISSPAPSLHAATIAAPTPTPSAHAAQIPASQGGR
jgi:NADH-quinone oxidoreductase subunit L